MTRQQIEAQALKLDRKARARLAHQLLLSLEEPSQAEVDDLWAEEAARRSAAIDADPSRLIPVDRVLRSARASLRRAAASRKRKG